jgi:hypothetical protein
VRIPSVARLKPERGGLVAAMLLALAGQPAGGEIEMTDVKELARNWVEVREEGSADRIVLRPQSYPIPPARGRRALDLSGPGQAAFAKAPGPDDKSVAKPGKWSVSGDELMIDAPDWAGKYTIEQISQDILVLRRK